MIDSSDEKDHVFPIGALLDGGRWRVTDILRGDADQGQLRAAGQPIGLVTIAPPQQGDRVAFVARLAWESPGIAPLLWSGSINGEGVTYDVLVEAEPDGSSLDTWQGSDTAARCIAHQLAVTVREAHDRGLVLGGLRPELVYIAGDALAGVTPRAERFFANATDRCYGVPPCFEHVYFSPEQLAVRLPGPPADVFALGATLARLLTGQAPFAGTTMMGRMAAALHGRHGSLDGAGSLAPLLDDMMAVEAGARPPIETVCDTLT